VAVAELVLVRRMASFSPDCAQIAAILPHVRYELGQSLIIPSYDMSDIHLSESIFLAILVHVRLLLDFFQGPRRQDDVVASDFGFPLSRIPLQKEDTIRLDKDILHLTYSRLRHTPETTPWPVGAIVYALRPRVIEFMKHVIENPPRGAVPDELTHWNTLYGEFTRHA
jgi:hypothetical protein